MKHHGYNKSFSFVKEPIEFDKYTDRKQLQYCLGATLYMPATKKFFEPLVNKKMPGLTSFVMCFEDAIAPEQLPEAQENVLDFLEKLTKHIDSGEMTLKDMPLLFFRVRSPKQFRDFSKKLKPEYLKLVTGFVFPKFSSVNGHDFLSCLKDVNNEFGEILYGMPILESQRIAFKETRTYELTALKNLLKPYRNLILNIRVGATDFSSNFGVRRGIDYSIYDILPVRDCLSDILNFLSREEDDYVISGPVWEYFLADKNISVSSLMDKNIHKSLIRGNSIINDAIDGLLKEVILDKANGFIGKTIIHPSHLNFVNAMQSVTKEEYDDAMQILETSGGVIKSATSNKMNEINPHSYWAKRICAKAEAYGVVENETAYADLFLGRD